MLKQGSHRRVLAAAERPLILHDHDHDRVPAPVRIRELSDQGGGLRAPGPRQLAGLPVSKNSAVITPASAASITACCRCRDRRDRDATPDQDGHLALCPAQRGWPGRFPKPTYPR
jgi:hypothetical protein